MIRFNYLIVLSVMLILAVSCGGNSGSPVMPGTDNTVPDLTSGTVYDRGATSKAVWGIWEVVLDRATHEFTVTPIRGVQYTVDVVTFLQPPAGNPANLQLVVTDVADWFTEGKITVEVGLQHPFPGLDMYTGFDVMGVFMSPGSVTGTYDTDVSYPNGVDEGILLNADGYTRWMNPTEFPDTGTILDFTPGKLSGDPIDMFTSTINGYKYFADELDTAEDMSLFFSNPDNIANRGKFGPGVRNWREYQLDFTVVDDSPLLAFQYAVVASWVDHDTTLYGDPEVFDIPEDFPTSANADEAVHIEIVDNSTVWYANDNGGGDVMFEMEVFDWGAYTTDNLIADEVHKIVVEAPGNPALGSLAYEFTSLSWGPGSGTLSSVVEIEITGCNPVDQEPIPLLITIENEDPDAFDPGTGIPNNDDRLAAYFMYNLPVSPEEPLDFAVTNPNGGETLYMTLDHEITWNPYYPGVSEVDIEWSTDDFVSDINVIVSATDNDGSYLWAYIPKVDTDTAKIRIRDVGGAIEDESDDYFAIKPPVALDFQDPMRVTTSNVTWAAPIPYYQDWDDISPALSQDYDGMIHVCWHNEKAFVAQNNRQARDTNMRSMDGDSWEGVGGFLFTSGGSAQEVHELRRDFMKLAPAANNTTFAAIWHWTVYFSLDVDHYYNGHNYYNAYCLFNRINLASEIMADADYVYTVSDGATGIGNGPGIYSYRFDTPNWAWPGQYDPKPPMNTLTSYGELSHSRSWGFQDDLLVLAYYTQDGKIKLLRQTDYTNDTWDDTEVIYDGSGYTQPKNPAICTDESNNLYVVWTGENQSSGEFDLLVQMHDGTSWSEPMVIASSTSDNFDDQHITWHSTQYELPNAEMEDILLIGYEVDSQVFYQIVMVDKWDWLPDYEVSDPDDVSRDPDVMCMDYEYNYDSVFTWSYEIVPGSVGYGDYDIYVLNGDFYTP